MLRPMAPTDRSAVAALLRQLGYHVTDDEVAARIAAIRLRPDHMLAVADFGVTVGWVHAYEVALLEEELVVEVGGIVVSDTARRRGSGTLLMAEVERWARERGVRQVRLRPNAKGKAAHRFLRALGYSEINKSLTFSKDLTPGE
jgi:GNAT superfamily N-acetyltransferase